MRTPLCIFVGTALLASAGLAADKKTQKSNPGDATSDDMRRAIEFQRAKDRADARQAAIEARHPSVFYNHAERSTDEDPTSGNKVIDPGPRPIKK